MKEKLKIKIQQFGVDSNNKYNPNNKLQGFIGSLYREDGTTLIREYVGNTYQGVLNELGEHAKWFNEENEAEPNAENNANVSGETEIPSSESTMEST